MSKLKSFFNDKWINGYTKNMLAYIVIIGYLVLNVITIWCPNISLTEYSALVMVVISYYFGSSEGSSTKNEIIKNLKLPNKNEHD